MTITETALSGGSWFELSISHQLCEESFPSTGTAIFHPASAKHSQHRGNTAKMPCLSLHWYHDHSFMSDVYHNISDLSININLRTLQLLIGLIFLNEIITLNNKLIVFNVTY